MPRPEIGRPGDRLAKLDFGKHNAEVKEVWDAYHRDEPIRVPIILGINSRYFMREPDANPTGIDFHRYSSDPIVMLNALLEFQRWNRFNVLQDQPLGPPESWNVGVDFQNYYEAAWFGCAVRFLPNEVPDTRPDFAESPESVMEQGMPDSFGGVMGRGIEFHEAMKERADAVPFHERPIHVSPGPGFGTDGPMTVACNLFGPAFVCETMVIDPERLHRLLDFITEATIRRMKAWRERFDVAYPQDGFGIADDSIALLSTPMVREHILPYHRRIYDAFATPAPRGIHLCGDSTRHFRLLRDELNIWSFDTGFPVDFAWLRETLGPKARIQGGPHVDLLRAGTAGEVRAEVKRILRSGILDGPFILREGNNLAPHTPLDNTEAMYFAGLDHGRLTVRDRAESRPSAG